MSGRTRRRRAQVRDKCGARVVVRSLRKRERMRTPDLGGRLGGWRCHLRSPLARAAQIRQAAELEAGRHGNGARNRDRNRNRRSDRSWGKHGDRGNWQQHHRRGGNHRRDAAVGPADRGDLGRQPQLRLLPRATSRQEARTGHRAAADPAREPPRDPRRPTALGKPLAGATVTVTGTAGVKLLEAPTRSDGRLFFLPGTVGRGAGRAAAASPRRSATRRPPRTARVGDAASPSTCRARPRAARRRSISRW